jgi:isopenicillin-N epimerase
MNALLHPIARDAWPLDPRVRYLNHGSFGACPRPVLAAQRRWRVRMEREPVRFLGRELEAHLDGARKAVAGFVGADPANLVFIANATTGVSTVLGSLRFRPGDELLATDHEYNATLNALAAAARRDGARVRIARIPFPLAHADEAVEAVLREVTPRTRLALVSHVTSPTAVVLPIGRLVSELDRVGVDTLVDGAHAPGMVPLDLDGLGAAWYAGNGHKWCCSPKGAAFLWARPDRQAGIRPLVTSHGANDPRTDRPRLWREFDWSGTDDPTAALSWPAALDFVGSLLPGGWPAVMRRNHRLAVEAQRRLSGAIRTDSPVPATMLGSMTAMPLPVAPGDDARELHASLVRAGLEVPIVEWPVPAARMLEPRPAAAGRHGRGEPPTARVLVRVSAQLYNGIVDIDALAGALTDRLR